VLILPILVLASACSSGEGGAGGPDAAPDVRPGEDAGPTDLGNSDLTDPPASVPPVLGQSLYNLLDEYLAFSGDPGVSLAVRTGDGALWAGAAGTAEMQTSLPMTSETSFRVGSNTKPYIAALTLQLVDEGLVELDAPLTDYLPEYQQWDDVTVRMLLGMQSGIPDYITEQEFMLTGIMEPELLESPATLVSFVESLPLIFEPGVGCAYCNTNYVLIGMIVEAVTGAKVQDELAARFFEPLGLSQTYLDMEDSEKPDLAHGYLDLAIVGFAFGIPAEALALVPADWFMEGMLVDATYLFPPMFSWTAGAMITTPSDALMFMRELLRGELVSEAGLAEMQKINSCELLGGYVDYGLGLMRTADTPWGTHWGHGGLNFGYEANTVHFPDSDLTISHMHNYLPEHAGPFQDEVLEMVANGSLETAYEPCLLPDGFFEEDPEETIHFRFKGPIYEEGLAPQFGGTTQMLGFMEGERVALYGFGTYAELTSAVGLPRVQLSSLAPSVTPGVDVRQTIISFDLNLLKGAEGSIKLEDVSPFDLSLGVLEVILVPGTQEPESACFVAVADLTQPAELYLCGGQDFGAETGETLKVFGKLPITRDPDIVESAAKLLGYPLCFCLDADLAVVDCESAE